MTVISTHVYYYRTSNHILQVHYTVLQLQYTSPNAISYIFGILLQRFLNLQTQQPIWLNYWSNAKTDHNTMSHYAFVCRWVALCKQKQQPQHLEPSRCVRTIVSALAKAWCWWMWCFWRMVRTKELVVQYLVKANVQPSADCVFVNVIAIWERVRWSRKTFPEMSDTTRSKPETTALYCCRTIRKDCTVSRELHFPSTLLLPQSIHQHPDRRRHLIPLLLISSKLQQN